MADVLASLFFVMLEFLAIIVIVVAVMLVYYFTRSAR